MYSAAIYKRNYTRACMGVRLKPAEVYGKEHMMLVNHLELALIESLGSGVTRWESKGGLAFIKIENALATCWVSLQGAQVLSYIPAGQPDLLWLSHKMIDRPGVAIRGGIPICWPWFGKAESASLPNHGFARTAQWCLDDVTVTDCHRLSFSLASNGYTQSMCSRDFHLSLEVTVGDALGLELIAKNTGDARWGMGAALHSYFAVEQLSQSMVEGLGCSAMDVQTLEASRFPEVFVPTPGLDKLFVEAEPLLTLHQPHSLLHIEQDGYNTSVCWNPGELGVAKLADISEDDWESFVCIESVINQRQEAIWLDSGQPHSLSQVIRYTPV